LKDTPHAIGLSIKVAGLLKDTPHACRDTLHALDCSLLHVETAYCMLLYSVLHVDRGRSVIVNHSFV